MFFKKNKCKHPFEQITFASYGDMNNRVKYRTETQCTECRKTFKYLNSSTIIKKNLKEKGRFKD